MFSSLLLKLRNLSTLTSINSEELYDKCSALKSKTKEDFALSSPKTDGVELSGEILGVEEVVRKGDNEVELPLKLLAHILRNEVGNYLCAFVDTCSVVEGERGIPLGCGTSSCNVNTIPREKDEITSTGKDTSLSNLRPYTDMCSLVFGQQLSPKDPAILISKKVSEYYPAVDLLRVKNRSLPMMGLSPTQPESAAVFPPQSQGAHSSLQSSQISNQFNNLLFTNEFLSLLDCVFHICRANENLPLYSRSLPRTFTGSTSSTTTSHTGENDQASEFNLDSSVMDSQLNLFKNASKCFSKVCCDDKIF